MKRRFAFQFHRKPEKVSNVVTCGDPHPSKSKVHELPPSGLFEKRHELCLLRYKIAINIKVPAAIVQTAQIVFYT